MGKSIHRSFYDTVSSKIVQVYLYSQRAPLSLLFAHAKSTVENGCNVLQLFGLARDKQQCPGLYFQETPTSAIWQSVSFITLLHKQILN